MCEIIWGWPSKLQDQSLAVILTASVLLNSHESSRLS
jgi:hypothetical protein